MYALPCSALAWYWYLAVQNLTLHRNQADIADITQVYTPFNSYNFFLFFHSSLHRLVDLVFSIIFYAQLGVHVS